MWTRQSGSESSLEMNRSYTRPDIGVKRAAELKLPVIPRGR
jgi:hypothetical protein